MNEEESGSRRTTVRRLGARIVIRAEQDYFRSWAVVFHAFSLALSPVRCTISRLCVTFSGRQDGCRIGRQV
jgi:hypothetical protein